MYADEFQEHVYEKAADDFTDYIDTDTAISEHEAWWDRTVEHLEAQSQYEEVRYNMDTDQIKEWLEENGHEPPGDAPDPSDYGLAMVDDRNGEVYYVVDAPEGAFDAPTAGGGDVTLPDRERGLLVYQHNGEYLTPDQARAFEENRIRDFEQMTREDTWATDPARFLQAQEAWRAPVQSEQWQLHLRNLRAQRQRAQEQAQSRHSDLDFDVHLAGVDPAVRAEMKGLVRQGAEDLTLALEDVVPALQRVFHEGQEAVPHADAVQAMQARVREWVERQPVATDILGGQINEAVGRGVLPLDAIPRRAPDYDRGDEMRWSTWSPHFGQLNEGQTFSTPTEAIADAVARWWPKQTAWLRDAVRSQPDQIFLRLRRWFEALRRVKASEDELRADEGAEEDIVRRYLAGRLPLDPGGAEPTPEHFGLARQLDGSYTTTAAWDRDRRPVGTVVYDGRGRYLTPAEATYWPVQRDPVRFPEPEPVTATALVPSSPRDPATLFEPIEGPGGPPKYEMYYSALPHTEWRELLTKMELRDNPYETAEGGERQIIGPHYPDQSVQQFQLVMDVALANGEVALRGAEAQSDLANKSTAQSEKGVAKKLRFGQRKRTYETETITSHEAHVKLNELKPQIVNAEGVASQADLELRTDFQSWVVNRVFPVHKMDQEGRVLLDGSGDPVPFTDQDKIGLYYGTDEGRRLKDQYDNAHGDVAELEALKAIYTKIKAQGANDPHAPITMERVENMGGMAASFIKTNEETGRLGALQLLTEWAERGKGRVISWANAEQLVNRWTPDKRELYRIVYDLTMPKVTRAMFRYLAAVDPDLRKLGFRAEDVTVTKTNGTSPYDPNHGWFVRIPEPLVEPLRKAILRNGLPILGVAPVPLIAAWATMASDDPNEEAARQALLTEMQSVGKAALIAGGIALAAYGARRMMRGRGGKLRPSQERGDLPHLNEDVPTSDLADLLGAGERKTPKVAGRGPLPRLTEKELSRLDLPPELAKEVVATMEHQRGLQGGPKTETWAETIAGAQKALDAGEDLLLDLDPERATKEQIIAIASLAGQKKRTADLFRARSEAPDLSGAEQRANAKMADKLDEDFLHLFIGSVRGSSEAGRTLNAMKVLANLRSDPEYWWRRTMKTLDRPLTPKERDTIRKFLADEDRAGLVQYLARLKKTSIPAQIVTLLNAGLFTRPAARGLDLLSSGGNLILEHGVNAPGRVLLDRAVALATGTRTATLPGALQVQGIGRGAWYGLQESAKSMGWHAAMDAPVGQKWRAWVDYIRNVEMTPEMLARYDLPHLTNIDLFSLSRNPEAPLNVIMDAAQKLVYRSLGVTDRILVKASYEGTIADLAMARALSEKAAHPKQRAEQLIANPPDDLRFEAMLIASRITFNNEETAAVMGKKIMRAPGDALRQVEGPVGEMSGELADAGMRFQFPVVRTVANITARVTDYIPGIGTTRGLYNLMQAFRKGLEPSLRNRKQRVAVEVLSRNLSGTGLVAMGIYLHQQGIMTGAASTDPGERAVEVGSGETPNSILWDGEWRPLGRLAPFGNLLAIGATLDQVGSHRGRSGDPLGFATGAAFAVGRTILDQPFLTGSRSALDALQDPVRRSESYLEGQAGRIVPTIVSEMAQGDGLSRDVNGPLDAIKARIPGLRDDLPIRYTGLGDPIRGRTGLMNRLFNPLAGTPDKLEGDATLRTMHDLGYMPGRPSRDPATRTTPQETPEAWSRRQAFIGGLRKTMVGQALSTAPLFIDPAYLEEAAREQQANNPDYAGMSLDEVKEAIQREFVRGVVRDVSPHTPPETVPRALGGTLP